MADFHPVCTFANMKKTFLFIALLPLPCLAQEKETWVDLPKNQWPVIALTNHVQFKNGDRYVDPSFIYAGTGFLIDNGKDTLAATAKHVLFVAKNKNTGNVEINAALKEWVMKPKRSQADSAVIDRLINEDSTEILEGRNSTIMERDWIIFTVKSITGAIYPLKPRYSPLKPGEAVYILSCAYDDSTSTISAGKVVRKEGMDILIERNMKEHLGGSSGSPVIDTNGYLIGVISSSTADNKTGKAVSVAISTDYLLNVLNNKPGLNTPKKDYGQLILQTVLTHGTRKAIRQYNRLTKDPANYYIYNLRSANRNGLLETGEQLIKMNRIKDAVAILKFNVKMNSGFFVNYNLLAKAYLLAGNKAAAISTYKLSTLKNSDEKWNEAFAELAKLNKG